MTTELGKFNTEDHENLQINAKNVKLSQVLKLTPVADPAAPDEGDVWYSSDDQVLKYYDGTDTLTLATTADLA